MDKLKNFLKDKAVGFYLSVIVALVAIATIIVLLVVGQSSEEGEVWSGYMSWLAFAMVIIGFVICIAYLVLPLFKLKFPKLSIIMAVMPIVIAVVTFLAIIFFGLNVFAVVTDGLTLPDTGKIILPATMLVILFLISNVNIYFKQIYA